MKAYRGFGYYTIFSPDDGGFYAEVSDQEGKDIEGSPTPICGSHYQAEDDALELIDAHPGAQGPGPNDPGFKPIE